MINVASLDVCKKLHKLIEWEETYFWYNEPKELVEEMGLGWPSPNRISGTRITSNTPAYDLYYALDKLPTTIEDADLRINKYKTSSGIVWGVGYSEPDARFEVWHEDSNPADAACKVIIELIERGLWK